MQLAFFSDVLNTAAGKKWKSSRESRQQLLGIVRAPDDQTVRLGFVWKVLVVCLRLVFAATSTICRSFAFDRYVLMFAGRGES